MDVAVAPENRIGPIPGTSQELFITSPARVTLNAGTRGSGKTHVAILDFCQDVGRGYGKNWRGLFVRRYHPSLEDAIAVSHSIIPQIWPKAKFKWNPARWTWPTGETLTFGQCENVRRYTAKWHGHQYPWLCVDELTTWSDSQVYESLLTLNRGATPGMRVRTRCMTNPYGPGHSWVKRAFIDRAEPGHIFHNDTGLTCVYLMSSVFENRYLIENDPTYIRVLDSITDPNKRLAWRYGSWDITGGGRFDHILNSGTRRRWFIEPFQIPKSWKVYRAFDWGSAKPFSVGWWAITDGTDAPRKGKAPLSLPAASRIRIHEYYGCQRMPNGDSVPNEGLNLSNARFIENLRAHEQGALKELGVDRVHPGPADTAIFNSTSRDDGTSISLHDEYQRLFGEPLFLPANKGPNSRIPGWDTVASRFEAALAEVIEEPCMMAFNRCRDFYRTMTEIQRDEKNPDDVDTDGEDHIPDETRYFATWQPPKPARGRIQAIEW